MRRLVLKEFCRAINSIACGAATFGTAVVMAVALLASCSNPADPNNPDDPNNPNNPAGTGDWAYADGVLDYQIRIVADDSGNGFNTHSESNFVFSAPITLGIYYRWFNLNKTQSWLDARQAGGITVIADVVGNGSALKRPDDETIDWEQWGLPI